MSKIDKLFEADNINPAFAMMFLTNVRGLDLAIGGFVMSDMGFNGGAGMILIDALSDKVGRRPVIIGGMIVGGLSFILFANVGSNPVLLL